MAQLGHVCIEAGNRWGELATGANIVVMAARDEKEFVDFQNRCDHNDIKFATFNETEYPFGTWAACSQPVASEQRKTFRRFLLWR
jgi:hypothetical protein